MSIKKLLASALPHSSRLMSVVALPSLRIWEKEHGAGRRLSTKVEFWNHLNDLAPGPIDYLEFGVFKGGSLRGWSSYNRHKDSRFFGFDTFTGLPDRWEGVVGGYQAGAFDAKGEVPPFDDPRVMLFDGLFQDTLDGFLESYDRKNLLIINCDADLYSSTLYVLTRCHDIIAPGSIVIFDEFSSVAHEFRALQDYADAYRRKYKTIASSGDYLDQVALEFL